MPAGTPLTSVSLRRVHALLLRQAAASLPAVQPPRLSPLPAPPAHTPARRLLLASVPVLAALWPAPRSPTGDARATSTTIQPTAEEPPPAPPAGAAIHQGVSPQPSSAASSSYLSQTPRVSRADAQAHVLCALADIPDWSVSSGDSVGTGINSALREQVALLLCVGWSRERRDLVDATIVRYYTLMPPSGHPACEPPPPATALRALNQHFAVAVGARPPATWCAAAHRRARTPPDVRDEATQPLVSLAFWRYATGRPTGHLLAVLTRHLARPDVPGDAAIQPPPQDQSTQQSPGCEGGEATVIACATRFPVIALASSFVSDYVALVVQVDRRGEQ